MRRFGGRLLLASGLLLALIPLLMCLYLGHFSRLMVDDYAYLGKALHDGIWNALIFWRNNWSGDYSNQLIYGLFASQAVVTPSVFPMILAAAGFLGFLWINIRALSLLGITGGRRIAAVAMSSLAVAATFNGFYTWQTFFWFSASVENSLPATILMLCLALSFEAAGRLRSRPRLTLASIVAALLAFINAGFSEMYMVFQLSFMALLAACVVVFLEAPLRRIYSSLACAACLGSFASLLVQLSAPGVAHRATQPENFGLAMIPIRDIGELLCHTFELAMQYAGHPAAFAGVMLMLTVSLFVTVTVYRPRRLKQNGFEHGSRPRVMAVPDNASDRASFLVGAHKRRAIVFLAIQPSLCNDPCCQSGLDPGLYSDDWETQTARRIAQPATRLNHLLQP